MRLVLAVAVLAAALPAAAADYVLDTAHSEVGFKIRHLGKRVSGRFTKFSGEFSFEPGKPQAWKASADIDASSINTDNEKRDAHLRGPDFFNAKECEKISFKSTKVVPGAGDTAKLHGDLTMHCVTKPVVLDLQVGGLSKDPWGNAHAGFSATGRLNRKDFGIEWNKTLDTGGLLLGDEVELAIEADGIEKKPAAAPAKKG